MLDQRRSWADVVQMLYTCYVFAGIDSVLSEYLYYVFLLLVADPA